MALDSSVKNFNSNMVGAPTLTGQAGQLVALLDALLVNGYALGTVDSITVTAGIGTAIRSAGHPFEKDTVGAFSGATGSYAPLNGERKILSRLSASTYTFDATGLPDGAVSGTVAHKMAPCGFTKVFAATNKGAYKSADVAATGGILRIDDTTTQEARASLYESMTDVDTGLPAGGSAGGYWPKSTSADATQRSWFLIGDARLFYLFVQSYPTTGFQAQAAFGDIVSAKSPDPFACMLHAGPSGGYNNSSPGGQAYDFSTAADPSSYGFYTSLLRSFTGVGGAIGVRRSPAMGDGINTSSIMVSGSDGNSHLVYPNPVDYALYLSPYVLLESLTQGKARRGHAPGVYYVPQRCGGAFGDFAEVSGVSLLPGHKLRAIRSAQGVMFVDTTGPWR